MTNYIGYKPVKADDKQRDEHWVSAFAHQGFINYLQSKPVINNNFYILQSMAIIGRFVNKTNLY